MPLKESLAAVLRLVRASRGLSKDDFQGVVDSKHIYNIENARSSVTLDTLEALSTTLEIDFLTLLTLAASLDRGESHHMLLQHLGAQGEHLAKLGVIAKWPSEFQDGELLPMEAGRRTPLKKVEAVIACRELGMTQKATAEEVGISRATVSRIWNRKLKT